MYENKLAKNAKKIDIFLKKKLNSQRKTSLNFPMRYGLLSGGKKIRSSIIINAGKIYNLKLDKLINVCAAVECIHSYSLIHDDLPCMDNDKFRRGKLSTHAKYGEATAVLAGNSLLTFAFEMITDTEYKIREKSKLELVNKLAFYSGHEGIAGGQDLDLNYENKNKTVKEILAMQKKKTGKLFNFCCFAVACLANRGQKNRVSLAKSLINKPEILLLDEPTASLDPDIGDFIRSYIQEYQTKNHVTILLASHNMSEVERLCDSVIMMKKGKIIDKGTCEQIIKKHGRDNLEETFLKLARSKDEL